MTTTPDPCLSDYANDTAFTVRTLCQSHLSIRKALYFQNSTPTRSGDKSAQGQGMGDQAMGIKADMPVSATLDLLEDEIARLLLTLPASRLKKLAQYVAHTHSPRLAAIVTDPDAQTQPSFLAQHDDMLFALNMGIDAFKIELDLGMEPRSQSLKKDFRRLMVLCEPEGADDWRTQTRRLVLRHPRKLIDVILWYILDRQNPLKQSLPRSLSVFLADLLTEVFREFPDLGHDCCEYAINGSSTYNLAALILAGAKLPKDKHPIPHGGPKVRALMDQCRSAHGHLEFIQAFGPLDRYLESGQAPNYTKTQA